MAGEKTGAARPGGVSADAPRRVDLKPFPEGTNCDIERPQRPVERGVRASELLLGAAALLPVALKIGRDVKRRVEERRSTDDRRRESTPRGSTRICAD